MKSATKKTTAKKTAAGKIAAKKAPKETSRKTSSVSKAVSRKALAKAKPAAAKNPPLKPPSKTPAKKTARKEKAAAASKEKDSSLEAIKKCWKALDDKKAENLRVLDVSGRSPITNYFIIATANSEPHMKALSGEVAKTLRDLGVKSVSRMQYVRGSGWDIVDAFDFMVHVFLPEQREAYSLESLWKDADEVDLQDA